MTGRLDLLSAAVRETKGKIRELDRVALCAEGFLELLHKKLHVIFGGQGAHYANAEDFARERSEAARDFNAGTLDARSPMRICERAVPLRRSVRLGRREPSQAHVTSCMQAFKMVHPCG